MNKHWLSLPPYTVLQHNHDTYSLLYTLLYLNVLYMIDYIPAQSRLLIDAYTCMGVNTALGGLVSWFAAL
jgi:hypothetical protein